MNEQYKENRKAQFEAILTLWGFKKNSLDYEKTNGRFSVRVDSLQGENDIRIYVRLVPFGFFLPQMTCKLDYLNDTLKEIFKFLNHC